jgi:hypothetical protein
VVRQTGTPSHGLERLQEREAELDSAMAQVERLLARKDSHVRIEEDQLVLAPLEASPRSARASALADRIAERLPRVELPELLIEVDTWTHFFPALCPYRRRRGAPTGTLAPFLCQPAGPCVQFRVGANGPPHRPCV